MAGGEHCRAVSPGGVMMLSGAIARGPLGELTRAELLLLVEAALPAFRAAAAANTQAEPTSDSR